MLSFTATGSFEFVGTSLLSRRGSLPEGARGVFIYSHLTFRTGVVTRFYAYVQRSSPIRFQVWRPVGQDRYSLVGEKRAVPSGPLGFVIVSK